MRPLDWAVLVLAVVGIVVYGVWKGRGAKDIEGYLLAGRTLPWYAVALSIMATQASAVTFLSAPGQTFVDGMRYVQTYLGLPIAMEPGRCCSTNSLDAMLHSWGRALGQICGVARLRFRASSMT